MIRRLILWVIYPVLKEIGKWHSPWTHKLIKASDVKSAFDVLECGDIFVTRTMGEITNLCIPGKFKHAAIYSHNGEVIEAKDPAVRKTNIYDFMMTKDCITIVRPKVSGALREKASYVADDLVGKPYDYAFDMPESKPNEAFYCAELPYWCYKKSSSDDFPFELRESLGVPTVMPDDYVNAANLFEVVWTNLSS